MEDGQEGYDWHQVVGLNPKGYLELNNGEEALYGPIQSVTINEDLDFVELRLKWAAKRPLENTGVPRGDWVPVSGEPFMVASFPNFVVPFVFETTPSKGPRIRFGPMSMLYIEDVSKLDPAEVKGLVLTNQTEG